MPSTACRAIRPTGCAPSHFSLCPGCRRVFWRGTHQSDMDVTIADILGKG
ncbi:MAG: Mut7-C RNAse domain-containing protein [Candidatus Aminicenantaceae bacterium]